VLVVVGGHSRKIGKTSTVAAIIRETSDFHWTAVKITQHGHGAPSLTEETDAAAAGDSARYLAAGAHRSYWLRAAAGDLGNALPALREVLASSRNTILESNSILEFIRPDLFLVVLDFANADFKESTRRFVNEADAFVVLDGDCAPPAWAGLVPLHTKPVFRVQPPAYTRPELVELLRRGEPGI
jgi:hypothetical protein